MGRKNDARAPPRNRPPSSDTSKKKADFPAPKAAERNCALAGLSEPGPVGSLRLRNS